MLPSAIFSYLVPRLGAWTTQIVGAVLATAVTSYVFKPTAAPAPAPAAIESRTDAANESTWARQASAPFDRADMLLPRPTFAAEVAPFPLQAGAMRPARAVDVVFVADPPIPPPRPRRAAAKPASERAAARAPAIVVAEPPAVIASAAAQTPPAAPVASSSGAIWSVAGGMVDALAQIMPSRETLTRPAGAAVEMVGRWVRIAP